MLFNSLEFFIFLPIVLALYMVLPLRGQNAWLLVASYVFYGSWDWRFLGLILISTGVDYVVGLKLRDSRLTIGRKPLLAVSIVTNLGILGLFKYYGFFASSLAALLDQLGFQAHITVLQLVLPVGISFYTFQTMSYTIDVYRRRIEPTADLVTFALYVAYFPQLVAGPIERAHHLLPLLQAKRRLRWLDLAVGFELILIGFFKKVAVADTLGPIVDSRFGDPTQSSGLELLITIYLFAFQIYGDFSGYSDIARGTSRLFGIDLMRNFNQPYLAQSITEFWRRWHISLSTWLRDYLYISLGGNRRGIGRTYTNLLITMLLGGLWHGASWTFVVWGGIHGLYLSVHKAMLHFTGKSAPTRDRRLFVGFFKIFVTFHLVCLTWIFFRAPDFTVATEILMRILNWRAATGDLQALVPGERILILLTTLILIDIWQAKRADHAFMVSWHWIPRAFGYAGLILLTLTLGNLFDEAPFIYFQF